MPDDKFFSGLVQHTVGWPTDMNTYQGTFLYHKDPNQVHFGLVIGLNYKNPYINPYEEFQVNAVNRLLLTTAFALFRE